MTKNSTPLQLIKPNGSPLASPAVMEYHEDPIAKAYRDQGFQIQRLTFGDESAVFAVWADHRAYLIDSGDSEFAERYMEIEHLLQEDFQNDKRVAKSETLTHPDARDITPYPFDRCTAIVAELPPGDLVMFGLKVYQVDISRPEGDETKLYLSGGKTHWEVRDMQKRLVTV